MLVPGTQWIVSSGMAEGAGFYLVDSRGGQLHALLPFTAQHDPTFRELRDAADAAVAEHPRPQRPRERAPSRARLYVVGHGAREAIEVFDIDATGARPTLTWRGCVPMPEGLAANSVASFADGSIVATVLFMPGTTFADADRRPQADGRRVRVVARRAPASSSCDGTELPANNGIEVSADGREIYVASSGLQTIVAFSHSNPARQLRTTRPLPFTPDNVHLGPDGRLRDGRHGQRRARVRRPAGPAARHREALGVPAPDDRRRHRSRDDARHRDRDDDGDAELQQRDDGAARRARGLDRHVLGRPIARAPLALKRAARDAARDACRQCVIE